MSNKGRKVTMKANRPVKIGHRPEPVWPIKPAKIADASSARPDTRCYPHARVVTACDGCGSPLWTISGTTYPAGVNAFCTSCGGQLNHRQD
jgi:hypothetical protein